MSNTVALVDTLNEQARAVIADIRTNYMNNGEGAIGDMALSILTAESFEAMFESSGAEDVDEWLNKPFNLNNVTFAESDKGNDGLPVYAVLHVTDANDQTEHVITCGAWQVVFVSYKCVQNGWLPKMMTFRRSPRPTRQGYYPINMVPVGRGEVEEPF